MISPFDALPRDTWVNVDVAQLTRNMRLLIKTVETPALAVVKANGYGHGYENAAYAFLAGGASYLGVATLSEGLLLRGAGITAPILIICAILPHEMKLAIESRLEFLVWRKDHITALREMTSPAQKALVHLKIDTGMGRLGCAPEEATEIARQLSALADVEFVGLSTHFASAYNPALPDTENQIKKFDDAIAALAAIGLKPRIVHAANSSGALYYPKGRYQMVRFGISMYGVPGEMISLPDGIKTALTWHAKVTSTSVLPKGHGVSYASEYRMPDLGRIGVLPLGYADGFQRVPKNVNKVLIEGQERSTLGRVCMDQTMIDLKDFDDIVGAEAVLIGRQGDREISVRDIAKRWGTNAYSVYCGISIRVPRRVIGRGGGQGVGQGVK